MKLDIDIKKLFLAIFTINFLAFILYAGNPDTEIVIDNCRDINGAKVIDQMCENEVVVYDSYWEERTVFVWVILTTVSMPVGIMFLLFTIVEYFGRRRKE